MSARYWLRLGADAAKAVLAEVVERGSRRAVAWLMSAPGGGLPGVVAGAPAAEPLDNLRFLSEDEELEASLARSRMRAERKPKSRPSQEDGPPNAPLVGSLDWRKQQRAGKRGS